MNSEDVKVIARSEWKPAERGTVRHRVVVWDMEGHSASQPQTQYATHMECDLENGSPLYFHEGHYNLKLGEAVLDFEARCKQTGIPPVPVTELDPDDASDVITELDRCPRRY